MFQLTHEQVRFYRTQGYFRLLNVFDNDEVEELLQFVSRLKADEDQKRFASGTGPIVKMYDLYNRNPEKLSHILSSPTLIGALTSILGPNVVFITNRHNHASVNDSHGTSVEARMHRDVLQPSRGLLTAAVYLEESTLENGCTRIVPGSQYLPYVGVPQLDGGGTWMDEHSEFSGLLDQAIAVPMPRGSVLLFDALAFHGVGQNLTDKTRTSITLGFRSADELDFSPDPERQIMVAGSQIYRGNDIKR